MMTWTQEGESSYFEVSITPVTSSGSGSVMTVNTTDQFYTLTNIDSSAQYDIVVSIFCENIRVIFSYNWVGFFQVTNYYQGYASTPTEYVHNELTGIPLTPIHVLTPNWCVILAFFTDEDRLLGQSVAVGAVLIAIIALVGVAILAGLAFVLFKIIKAVQAAKSAQAANKLVNTRDNYQLLTDARCVSGARLLKLGADYGTLSAFCCNSSFISKQILVYSIQRVQIKAEAFKSLVLENFCTIRFWCWLPGTKEFVKLLSSCKILGKILDKMLQAVLVTYLIKILED